MLIEWLMELKDQIDRHGIRVGLILTLFVMYRKELRNKRLDMRDEAMFQNQRIIMKHLGIGDQWIGQPVVSHKDLANYKPLLQYYSVVISRVAYQSRRGSKMNKAWLVTLVAYVLGAAAKKWGIVFPDETANWVVDGVMMAIPVLLAFMNHKKKESVPSGSNAQYSGDGPAV